MAQAKGQAPPWWGLLSPASFQPQLKHSLQAGGGTGGTGMFLGRHVERRHQGQEETQGPGLAWSHGWAQRSSPTPDPAEAGPREWKETEAWRTEVESCGLGFSPCHLEPQFPFLGF